MTMVLPSVTFPAQRPRPDCSWITRDRGMIVEGWPTILDR
jgi:hypothetical protein